MTHSGFKTAQKRVNSAKKENNNKDYRTKPKIGYGLSTSIINIDYILRTKHHIYLNEKNKNYLFDDYTLHQRQNRLIHFDEHSTAENAIIQQELHSYYNNTLGFSSRDKTHSTHSKIGTKNRNKGRSSKLVNSLYTIPCL